MEVICWLTVSWPKCWRHRRFFRAARFRRERLPSRGIGPGRSSMTRPRGFRPSAPWRPGGSMSTVAVDGRDVWLNSLYTGECFGIYNLVAASDLETVLCCGEDTVICYIDKVTLRRWMETDQKLAFQYAALCNAKLQFLIKRIEQLTTQTCCGKIAAYLLAHRSADGQVKSSCSRMVWPDSLGSVGPLCSGDCPLCKRPGNRRPERGLCDYRL